MLRPDGRASARKSFVFLVVGMVIFFLGSFSSADVPHMISYQGKLTTASGGCLNDTVQMTFTIYSDDQGISDEWTETQTEVVVKEGIFNVLLGSVDTIPTAVFDGNVKYLGVQVESDPEMRPLKPMVSVAYAYRAGTADGGGGGGGWVDDGTVVRLEDSTDQVGIGTSNPRPGYKLHLKDDAGVYLLFDHSRDTTWILGSSVAGNQSFYIGQENPFGGMSRLRIMTNGDTYLCPATGKVGIGSTGTPREKLDVAGDNDYRPATVALTNPLGIIEAGEVLGHVRFYGADGGNQIGAEIRSSAVEEWTPGSSAADLRFLTTPPGSATPVDRVTISDDGNVGIGTTTPNASAKLHVAGTDWYAGYFTSSFLSDTTHVIHSEYTGSGSGFSPVAVYGKSRPADNRGFGGCFEGGVYGVVGMVAPTGSNMYYGVRGDVRGGSGTNWGVLGYASGGGYNVGVFYSGGLEGTGTKSCVVKTSQGPTLLYCQESPENWFEDFGEGQLANGRVHIELDALFLETVTIDGTNPMKVFIQLEGDCNGVYVSKGTTSFDVIEFKGGTSNVPFSYRVVAKRKGFENKRLDYTPAGENDPYLYPEATERLEKEREKGQIE